jgi:hypothetical protein
MSSLSYWRTMLQKETDSLEDMHSLLVAFHNKSKNLLINIESIRKIHGGKINDIIEEEVEMNSASMPKGGSMIDLEYEAKHREEELTVIAVKEVDLE